MNAVYCLDCDRKLHINSKHDVGDAIKCPLCDSEFEIVSMQPPAIEWLYDDYDDYDDEDEEEEEEEVEILGQRAATQDQKRPNDPRLVFSASWDE